jgi:hypothetical protein
MGGNARLSEWLVVISTMKLKVLWRAMVPAGKGIPARAGTGKLAVKFNQNEASDGSARSCAISHLASAPRDVVSSDEQVSAGA